ncbi:hypothetical protein IW140_003734 [Coemansia sp. RSA 1813]|nr:hypothetical protein EV178_003699 [Coemansia sp. RSA 1646]KAJ1768869.1 hypothetical protein LPJ74_004513 [Coemansia sp. RSA 1843]KAJ2088738.1 hypothetical protein IW138_004010 [Coemansia sp. RSA 986]KAJ2213643.1 hypothetical protein EV179_003643 [Coemansia sp. RSA 487]KAJ2568640.1 hypothetical protein IW140_003734 [Coemansia sp. RSA 1813]
MPKSLSSVNLKFRKSKWKPYDPNFKQKLPKKKLAFSPQGKANFSPPHAGIKTSGALGPYNKGSPNVRLPKDAGQQMKTAERSLYWCQEPGQQVMIQFKGRSVLGIISGNLADSELLEERDRGECDVLVLGLCPFHVIAKKLSDETTYCGGSNVHMHEKNANGPGMVDSIASQIDTLDTALVTQPMPMSAVIRLPELRVLSLYVYEDAGYRKSYPGAYTKIESDPPPLLSLDPALRFDYFVNPVCYRMLQQRAHEKLWRLDESCQYSLEQWENELMVDNVPFFKTGMRVPCPKSTQFCAPVSGYKISMCFWNGFQREMWEYFLKHETGPCYLDATYQCDKDGFQVWTLFFEYHNITVPVSYLVSTAITVNLIKEWLEAIMAPCRPLPKKTIYVNSTKLIGELSHVFSDSDFDRNAGWDVCYAKYYIMEEFKSLVLRAGRCPEQWDAQTVDAVKNIDIDLDSVLKVAKPGTALSDKVGYLLDKRHEWLPKPNHDLGLFNHSGVAVSRWRYLLWMTMLGRPNNGRVDSVIYYLHKVLTVGIEATVKAYDSGKHRIPYASMDSMEQGDRRLKKSLAHARVLPLADQLVCVSNDRELSSKAIVDLKYKVCFCSQFAEHRMCEHLVFCSSSDVHQPELVKLLEVIPYV